MTGNTRNFNPPTVVWAIDLDSADSLSAQYLESGGDMTDNKGFGAQKTLVTKKQNKLSRLGFWTPCMSAKDRRCPGSYHEIGMVGHGNVYDFESMEQLGGCKGRLDRLFCLRNDLIDRSVNGTAMPRVGSFVMIVVLLEHIFSPKTRNLQAIDKRALTERWDATFSGGLVNTGNTDNSFTFGSRTAKVKRSENVSEIDGVRKKKRSNNNGSNSGCNPDYYIYPDPPTPPYAAVYAGLIYHDGSNGVRGVWGTNTHVTVTSTRLPASETSTVSDIARTCDGASVWRNRDGAYIRFLPGGKNGGVANFFGSRWSFDTICQWPLQSRVEQNVITTVYGVYMNTVWVRNTMTKTRNRLDMIFTNMQLDEQLTQNQCWPRTLTPDAEPGFALFNYDRYYAGANTPFTYAPPPVSYVTAGKTPPMKRDIQHALASDGEEVVAFNEGNSSDCLSDEELAEHANIHQCKEDDCREELDVVKANMMALKQRHDEIMLAHVADLPVKEFSVSSKESFMVLTDSSATPPRPRLQSRRLSTLNVDNFDVGTSSHGTCKSARTFRGAQNASASSPSQSAES